MSLTRKDLKELGLEEAQIETIIGKHIETVTALKDERDALKTTSDRAADVQKQLDEANAALTAARADADTAKKDAEAARKQLDEAPDYAALKAEYDGYKQTVETEKVTAKKSAAVLAALKAAGATETAARLMLNGVKLDAVELDDGGTIKDADGVIAPCREQYAAFFGTETEQGVPPVTPPAGGKPAVDYAKLTDAEYFKVKAQEHKAG